MTAAKRAVFVVRTFTPQNRSRKTDHLQEDTGASRAGALHSPKPTRQSPALVKAFPPTSLACFAASPLGKACCGGALRLWIRKKLTPLCGFQTSKSWAAWDLEAGQNRREFVVENRVVAIERGRPRCPELGAATRGKRDYQCPLRQQIWKKRRRSRHPNSKRTAGGGGTGCIETIIAAARKRIETGCSSREQIGEHLIRRGARLHATHLAGTALSTR